MKNCFLKMVLVLVCGLMAWNPNVANAKEDEEAFEGPIFYEFPEMIVNLRSSGRAVKVLKIRLNLEMDSEEDIAIVDKIKPRMMNEFQLYLRHLYPEDLNGNRIKTLKEELLARANLAARPIKFKDVLFRGLLVQ